MTNKLDSSDRGVSVGDERRKRAYLKEFVPVIVVGLAGIVATNVVGNESTADKVFELAARFVPLALLGLVIVRHICRLDDYEKLITFRAMSVGFGLSMLSAVFFAFANTAGLELSSNLESSAPFLIGMLTWGVGVYFQQRQA